MKFLIENYANVFDTQALYLHRAISKTTEHQSVSWDSNSSSIYDIMDKENPDYYITSATKLSKDFAQYTKDVKNIKLLLSVDYIPQKAISVLEKSIIDAGIECCFFFSSNPSVSTKKIRFVHINHAYDPNLKKSKNTLDYKIETAIFVTSEDSIKKHTGTYHFISNNEKIKEKVDILLPEHMLFCLYGNYSNVIFNDIEDYVPQSFFDAAIESDAVYYDNINDNSKESIKKLFKIDKSLDYNEEDRMKDFSKMKLNIREKHTPENRVKTLLSQLPRG